MVEDVLTPVQNLDTTYRSTQVAIFQAGIQEFHRQHPNNFKYKGSSLFTRTAWYINAVLSSVPRFTVNVLPSRVGSGSGESPKFLNSCLQLCVIQRMTHLTKTIVFFLSLASFAARATSIRGNTKRKLRPINPDDGRGKDNSNKKEIACTLFLKEILLEPEIPTGDPVKDFANARTVTSWSCEVDDKEVNGNTYGINNNKRKNFKRFLDLRGVDKSYLDQHANSGSSILRVTGANMKLEELEISKDATFVVEDIPESHRRLAPSLGTLKTKVVRVSGSNGAASPTATAAQLKNDIFDDASCLKSQYNACSKGALTITEGPIEEVTIATDPSGPADVTRGWMEGNATALVAKADYQLLHEVGHNLGLAHAGEARVEYGDQTGMMGYSYSQDDQYMCFNAVNNYQLQWFPGQYADVMASTYMASQTFVFNGVESAGSIGAANGKKIAVRVRNVYLEDTNLCCTNQQYYTGWRTRDIYIGFNYDSGSGINRNSAEYKNRVTVHQKNSNNPSAYAQSWLLTALVKGQIYSFPNFDGLGQGHTLNIKFIDQVNEDAFVEMFVTGLEITGPCLPITVDIVTDRYPGETSWVLTNGNAQVLMLGGSYTAQNTLHSQTKCVEEGNLSFTINDTYSDGLCCSYGQGSYAVKNAEGVILAQGAQFGASETKIIPNFGAVGSPTNSPTTPAPTMTPTNQPTPVPTPSPTLAPTMTPTNQPTPVPTPSPTPAPTMTPTNQPTPVPPPPPTLAPTMTPTNHPTPVPTPSPTIAPTMTPTKSPTTFPTPFPTLAPTMTPTNVPTSVPTLVPTKRPTNMPTPPPTTISTRNPTPSPTRVAPVLETTIFTNQDFEVNFGSVFISGGKDCSRVLYSKRNCIRLRNNSGIASSMFTASLSVAGYNALRLEFDYTSTSAFLVEWRVPNGSWISASVGVSTQGFVRAKVNFDSWIAQGKPASIALRIRSITNKAVTYVDNVIFYGLK
ncbi:polymorphic outer membrane domain containing protein [Nitzschia inconspicua]|uniref:Polymorphic outer membrane domain containing protein n=1 Tax=Nitzschia inconspicua TaxID=303405 RepID=A0A9K3M676_9STRA|nr:polymorphic outer membrane domain containing protein [Nitzschia inconspicua]